MSEIITDGIQTAGDVAIHDLTLIGANGVTIDLDSFLIELNLFEDIFSPCLSGNILLTDSLNIVEKLPILGGEYLRIKIDTPSLGAPIFKTFVVYNITDRVVVLDDKTSGFILHFCSPEMIVDSLGKVHKTFSGKISDVVENLYSNYLKTPRNVIQNDSGELMDSSDSTNLNITDEPKNSVKFVSPGWGPVKCLSWLAAKSLSEKYNSSDYLFFESSKQFYFGTISSIIDGYKSAKVLAGAFYYKVSNLRTVGKNNIADKGVQYVGPDVKREYSIAENFKIVSQFNTMQSINEGHFASQMISLNLTNKRYQYNNFDFGKDYDKYIHAAKTPLFTQFQLRNPQSSTIMNIQQTGLHDGMKKNVNETAPLVTQNRISLLKNLTNLVIEIVVPGRTNMECGSVVYFAHPALGPKGNQDKVNEDIDDMLSGLYFVSAIRHKINPKKHVMTMELCKDGTDLEIK